MKTKALALLLACAVLFLSACGNKGPAPGDTAPYRAAITSYLQSKSMGMEVEGFESLEVAGDTATTVCRMAVADDLYGGVTVRWRFTFERTDGGWKVTQHEKL